MALIFNNANRLVLVEHIYMVKNGVDNKYDGVSAANTHTAYDWDACKGMSAGCLGY